MLAGCCEFSHYYFFLIIHYFFAPFLLHTHISPFGKQIYYWVYLQNFAITFHWPADGPSTFWSLAVEGHFYLLWPCLVYFLSKKGLKTAVVALLVLSLGCRLLLLYRGYEVFYFTFTRLDEIAIGSFLAIWEIEGKLKGNAKKFLFALVLVLIPTLFIWTRVTGKAMFVVQAFKYNLLGFCYFCLVGLAVSMRSESAVNRVLSSRPFSFTGKISYGLYVYHPLFFVLIAFWFPQISLPVRFVLCFGGAYLVAYLSYTLLEARFIGLKKRFAYNRSATINPPIEERSTLEPPPVSV